MSVGIVDKVDGILLVVLVWENRTQGTHFLKIITYATFVVFGLLILDWFSGNEFFWVTVSAPRILISQECISYWRHLNYDVIIGHDAACITDTSLVNNMALVNRLY